MEKNKFSNETFVFSQDNTIDDKYFIALENHLINEKVHSIDEFPLPPTPKTSDYHGKFTSEDKEKLRHVE